MAVSLKLRFLLSSLLSAGGVVLYAVDTLEEQKATNAALREALERGVTAMALAADLKHAFVLHDDLVFRFLATGDETWLEDSKRARRRAEEAVAAMEGGSDGPETTELVAQLRDESAVYFRGVRELIDAAPSGVAPGETGFLKVYRWAKEVPERRRAVGALSARGRTRLNAIHALCDDLQARSRARLEAARQELDAALKEGEARVRWHGTALIAGSALIAGLLALSILAPLRRLESGIARVIGGDLDFEIEPRGGPELASIARAFNAMTGRLRAKHAELEREAVTDALTGLRNFRWLEGQLEAELARARRHGRPLSLLLVDVDKFKAYNDAHGHEGGNEALRTTAEALMSAARKTDRVARYGGEEFVVLLPETPKDKALLAAERFRKAVAARGLVTVSIGGATFPEVEALIEKADGALYRSKSAGRDRVEWA